MGKSKKSSIAAKKVAENRMFEVPEMTTAAQIWLALTTKPKHLLKLHEQGYLPKQKLGEWKVPREHHIPILESGEIVLFVPFIVG